MRFQEIVTESRGVTARVAGDTYVNLSDKNDVLTIVDVSEIPTDKPAYDSVEELAHALEETIPANSKVVEDNRKTKATRAALVATVINAQNQTEYHVRYIQAIPAHGTHERWKTIRGYQYSKGLKRESVPIKPADIITDENYRTASELATAIVAGVKQTVSDEQLIAVIENAVKAAIAGKTGPIAGGAPYFHVLQKYASEYLGPLGVISGGFTGGDTAKMLQQLDIDTFSGSRIKFPQNKQQELIDSIVQTPGGTEIQISSKISTNRGAASSLSGVAKLIDQTIQQKYPVASSVIKTLAEKHQVDGPLTVALQLGIIDQQDIRALSTLDKRSKNIADLGTENLRNITKNQGTRLTTPKQQASYRVFFHAMNAIVNLIIARLNRDETVVSALRDALNDNQYVQIVTKGRTAGNDIYLDYRTKFPAAFAGKPQLFNKNHASTGIKGRLGFKLV